MSDSVFGSDIIPAPYRRSSELAARHYPHVRRASIWPLIAHKLKFSLRSLFHVGGFVALNSLAALGLVVVFFIILGSGEPAGFFTQLAEIARRFLGAGAERQAEFVSMAITGFVALVAVISLVRAVGLRDKLSSSFTAEEFTELLGSIGSSGSGQADRNFGQRL